MQCDGMASPLFPSSFLLPMQSRNPHEEEGEDGRNPSASIAPDLLSGAASAGQDLHELAALLSGRKRSGSFPGLPAAGGGGEEELSDGCSGAGGREKKIRRLSVDQVRALERSFEMVGNKLEPERKMELAKAVGLQPRQVAVWFQNRRARWKTKQLEKDYEDLRRQVDASREENGALQALNKKLQAEVSALRGNKETEGSCSNRSDNSSDINLQQADTSSRAAAAAAAAAADTVDAHLGRPLFHPVRPAAAVGRHLQDHPTYWRPDQTHLPRVEHGGGGGGGVRDEHLCDVLSGLDDQPAAGFCWGWSEEQHASFFP